MSSAWTRCAPSATNISPTTDLPDAMLPVRPTFSNPPPTEIALPQRWRDAEKMQKRKRALSSVLLYFCVERLSFAGKIRYVAPATHFRSFHRVVHEHRDGQRTDSAGNGGEGCRDLNHLGMHIADQGGSLPQEILFALGMVC